MIKASIFILCFFIFTPSLYSSNLGEDIAKKLHLNAAYKAMMQWERVFSSEKKMKRYKIAALSKEEKKLLKTYLIKHAIDSDHPTVAGEF